jgi:hypothetical protein
LNDADFSIEDYKKRKVVGTRLSYREKYHPLTEKERAEHRKTIEFIRGFDFSKKQK